MATFNLSKKSKKEKSQSNTKKIVGASLLAAASVVFLFSATTIWPWLQGVLLGIFGVACYPLCVLCMFIGLALLNNRKYVMSKRYAVFMALSVIFLLAIIQLIIVGNKFVDGKALSYWDYLSLNFTKKWTAGGFLIGILTSSLLLPLNLAGTYVILSLGLVISVAFFAEALISYRKNANLNSPVKIQIRENKKKDKDEVRAEALKPKDEVNVVLNGEIQESLSREQDAKRKVGLTESMTTGAYYNNGQLQQKNKGGIPEGTSVKEYLLKPPTVNMDEFFAMQQKISRNRQNRVIESENKANIDKNFAEMKGEDIIQPAQHIYEQQYDFSYDQKPIKRGNLPEIKPEELLSQADSIILNAAREELADMGQETSPLSADDDFIISSDSTLTQETMDTSFTNRTDGFLRDNTDYARGVTEQGLSRDRANDLRPRQEISRRENLADRGRDNLVDNSRENLSQGRAERRNSLDLTKRADAARERKPKDKEERFVPYKYNRPSIDLITTQSDDLSLLNDEVPAKRVALENALEKFGVPAKVQSVVIGPTVTRYEIAMPEGISVKKILSLDADIAYALSARGQIRIEAPVPGRSIVGIEVPNNKVAKVSIKDVLMSKEFTMSPSPLAFALGKDITGTVRVCNLAKMPHLLVAGTTGSGKSVCLNAIIVSILYKASPDDVKFIMIDPKQVELSMYEGLPHMVVPKVITDATKAVNALQWAVDEMERRFNLISEARVRNIEEYNKTEEVVSGKKKKIPFLVVIFDEFADFMLVAKNEIEDKIMRLAQKARAAGIHLILATQRPSTDVVTGTIKANFPARIAFKVAGRVDSEVIMGATGAEKLLGYGDMLYKPSDSAPARIQGCFIDTPETKDIVNYIIQNNEETYDEEAFNAINNISKAPNGNGEDGSGMDPLLPQALKICIDVGVASTTMVQRKLSIGYPRAARIIDQMEERGYISSAEGSKQRTVYTSIEEFYDIFGDTYD